MKASIAPDKLTPVRIVRHESTTVGVPATTSYYYEVPSEIPRERNNQ